MIETKTKSFPSGDAPRSLRSGRQTQVLRLAQDDKPRSFALARGWQSPGPSRSPGISGQPVQRQADPSPSGMLRNYSVQDDLRPEDTPCPRFKNFTGAATLFQGLGQNTGEVDSRQFCLKRQFGRYGQVFFRTVFPSEGPSRLRRERRLHFSQG